MATFEELKEIQPVVIQLLVNAIEKDRLVHAYLFDGGRGTGKKRVALQLVKSFLCQNKEKADACHVCSDCIRIENGNHPDVHMIWPEGQSIKRSQRDFLQKEFTYRGVESSKKVYVINDADLMTASVANSILKFLEEPASPTLVLLLTEQGQKILPTIKSRSQHLTFTPLTKDFFLSKLEMEGNSPVISNLLASLTTSYEEALTLLEGDWIAQARSIVIQLMEELHSRPTQVLFTLQEKWLPLFKERWQQETGLELILLWLRDLLYSKIGRSDAITFIDQELNIQQQAFLSSQDRLSEKMSAVLLARRHLVANVNPQLLMEKLLLTIQEG